MNTLEIIKALRDLRAGSKEKYAADRIPTALSLPAAIIINTDTAAKKGEHWISLYIDENAFGSYFDSYGLPPTSPYHLDRIKRNCRRYQFNKKQLQSFDSKVCGEYCIMFLHHMCAGVSLRKFCRMFSRGTRKNDKLAENFYKMVVKKLKFKKLGNVHFFPRDTSTGSGFCNQSCTSKLESVNN